MKKALTAITALLILAGFSLAQKVRIGVVNPDYILANSKEGKKILSELQAIQKRKQAEIARRQKEIQDLQRKLQTQQGIMSQQALQNLEDKIVEKQKALKRYVDDAKDELARLNQKKLGAFQQKMLKVIKKVAKAKGLVVVLDQRQLIYADPVVDISSEVIGELDKMFDKQMGIGK